MDGGMEERDAILQMEAGNSCTFKAPDCPDRDYLTNLGHTHTHSPNKHLCIDLMLLQ